MGKLFILIFIFISFNIYSQNSFRAVIKDHGSGEILKGVTAKIKNTNIGNISDSNGIIFLNEIPEGLHKITFEHVAYEKEEKDFVFPLKDPVKLIEIFLKEAHHETEEIVISTTRLSRNIEDIPTRVETITREEIEEKINMEPANVVMLLSESTGIQTQQTSATSGNSNIKIQGLAGRYTQILKDGLPIYNGLSEGLGIMQLPPLDLRQVEVIKGPSSTLYGGGAIAGVINFLSFDPEYKPSLSALLNFESFGGFDLGAFYSGRTDKFGLSLLGTFNYKNSYDADKDDFTEIPKTIAVTIFPKIYYYPDNNTVIKLGLNSTYENRLGGDVTFIKNGGDTLHTYFERNISNRYFMILEAERKFKKENRLSLRNSTGYFKRRIEIPGYSFEGNQFSSYSEISYLLNTKSHHLIGGLNFISDVFREKQIQTVNLRDYDYFTSGIFAQDTWDISRKFVIETGLRYDYQNMYGSFILPRVTIFAKPSEFLSMRLTGGLGYETPSVFNEESEREGFENILPVSDGLKAETSHGLSMDFNFKTVLFRRLSISVNQLFFYTQIKNPLELKFDSALSNFSYINGNGTLDTKGFESNIKFVLEPFKLFAGYTFTDARSAKNGKSISLAFTPKHSLGFVLMYEKHENLRVGYEAYYTSEQSLYNGAKAPSFWVMGIMAQKHFGNFILFLNFENFTDTRQSKFGPVVYSNHNNPLFEDIWTHTEGFYVNGGIKIKF